MSKRRIIRAAWLVAALLPLLPLTLAVPPAAAAKTCGFPWAVPGAYEVSGNFRGQVDTITARLTNSCRVSIDLPGVFTGGRVRPVGRCLGFSFRVEGERQTFSARWCGDYGVVPWQGRDVRATIVRRPDRANTGNR